MYQNYKRSQTIGLVLHSSDAFKADIGRIIINKFVHRFITKSINNKKMNKLMWHRFYNVIAPLMHYKSAYAERPLSAAYGGGGRFNTVETRGRRLLSVWGENSNVSAAPLKETYGRSTLNNIFELYTGKCRFTTHILVCSNSTHINNWFPNLLSATQQIVDKLYYIFAMVLYILLNIQ